MAELAALADGSLAPERRAAVEARVAASSDLADRLVEQQRAVALAGSAVNGVEAPAALRARIDAQRRVRRVRVPRRLVLIGAPAVAALAVAIGAIVIGSGPSSERFHAALAAVPRPDAIIDSRANPWATLDRVAWGERRYDGIDDLLGALEPVDDPSQLIHGDLTGNVLFHEKLPPAIIDFAPYWRPTEYATAIVATDAVLWEAAPSELLDDVHPQYILRALIYRGVTSIEFGTDWRPTIELARRIARCESR